MLEAPLLAVATLVWWAILIVGLIVMLVLAVRGHWFSRINAFLSDVLAELRKVSWPTWGELRSATVVVIVSTALVAVFVVVVDVLLARLMGLIF